MAKAASFKVQVTLVGTSGKPQNKEVSVTAKTTCADVALAAGLDKDTIAKLNFYVDDEPALANTLVTSASKVLVKKVKITERPQGS